MSCCLDNFVGREGEGFIAQVCVQNLLQYLSAVNVEENTKKNYKTVAVGQGSFYFHPGSCCRENQPVFLHF